MGEDVYEGFIYRRDKARVISFPIGGIGTGCIGLAGNGRLIDWEIFNRPNKGGLNGFSHFAVKAEADGTILDARILNGDLPSPYIGESRSYGFGPPRECMAGFPHFKDFEFEGTYPIAKVRFSNDKFPGRVQMTAFNPFIPLNDRDSSIPAAFFEIEVENTSLQEVSYTVCLVVQNPLPAGTTVNSYGEDGGIHFIKMTSIGVEEDSPSYGDMTVATDASDVSYQEYLFRGSWFDTLHVYWRDLTTPGRFRNRRYDKPRDGVRDHALLAVHLNIKPRESRRARFIISWNFPNCYNYWKPEKGRPTIWRNYYAKIFKDSVDTAIYSLNNWDKLYGWTSTFKDSLFTSTLPQYVIDAVSANLSILKSPTVLRLEDGSLYGFEGCHPDSGCCEGSCMHVWSYAYATLFLFPKLDRSMWDLHYRYSQRRDGGISFRLQLPLGRGLWDFPHAAADGQFCSVIRAYAYWKFTGDDAWLKANWGSIEKSIEYAWSGMNEDRWDMDRDGVLEGRQHNTLDIELFEPNPWLTGLYLAALKAGAEMAEYLGYIEKAREYRAIYDRGRRWVEDNLFNGEYFYQLIDLRDRGILEEYSSTDPRVVEVYWDDEHGEIKYQVGEGCLTDQVLAQWHANICGLGEVLDRGKVKSALKSIYKYNFRRCIRDSPNPCRLFSLNDEAGIIICSWPEGKLKPVIPIPYAEETWCGVEYAAASHMIQEGLIEEGLEVVKAVRDRYDGEKRNPWNEIECGSNYARSMSSYILLLALSGFKFDMRRGMIGFNPVRMRDGEFRCFWSTGSGWGVFEVRSSEVSIKVEYGVLEVRILDLPFIKGREVEGVIVAGRRIEYERLEGEIRFAKTVTVRGGEYLRILLR